MVPEALLGKQKKAEYYVVVVPDANACPHRILHDRRQVPPMPFAAHSEPGNKAIAERHSGAFVAELTLKNSAGT